MILENSMGVGSSQPINPFNTNFFSGLTGTKSTKSSKSCKKKPSPQSIITQLIAAGFAIVSFFTFGPIQMMPMYALGMLIYIGGLPLFIIGIIAFFSIFYFR